MSKLLLFNFVLYSQYNVNDTNHSVSKYKDSEGNDIEEEIKIDKKTGKEILIKKKFITDKYGN